MRVVFNILCAVVIWNGVEMEKVQRKGKDFRLVYLAL